MATSSAPQVQASVGFFPYLKWEPELTALAKRFRDNRPYPHIRLVDFLGTDTATAMAQEFPHPSGVEWTQYKHTNENKLGMPKRDLFPSTLGAVTDELNSREFVAWLSELTGIPNLIADPMLEGGGLHQSGPGGYLNVHTDFSMHHYHRPWHRRVNLILYLNPEWCEEWGGALELWERGMVRCGAKYPPLLNHALIFATDERSLHGFPDPLTCPEGTWRKSLALYYCTVEQDKKFAVHSTDYHARPQDGWGKAFLIWLDKKAVDLYSRAKMRFGFSDQFASKVLGFLSKKK
ncbi:MAG: proline hydroxylase [Acidobacteria bacterium]|nr:MAG: proline hydroxylase [Acidobacteriota bacterium]